MALVQDVIAYLGRLGLWDVVLPFILVFTITYAILERTKVLGAENGEPKHRFNAMLAVVIGFIVLIAVDTLNVINVFSEMIVILILVAVCIAVIFGFFGFQEFHKKWYFMAIAVLVFGIASLYALGLFDYLDWNALRRYEGVIVGLIIFFIVLWIILRPAKKAETAEKKDAEERKAAEKPVSEKKRPSREQLIVDLNKLAALTKDLPDNVKQELYSAIRKHPAASSGRLPMEDFHDILAGLSEEAKEMLSESGLM